MASAPGDGRIELTSGVYDYPKGGIKPDDLPFSRFVLSFGANASAELNHAALTTASVDLVPGNGGAAATANAQVIRDYDQATNTYSYCVLFPVVDDIATQLGLQNNRNATGYMGILFYEKKLLADQYTYAQLYNFGPTSIRIKDCFGYAQRGAFQKTFGIKQFTHVKDPSNDSKSY